jgi:hypothetical protein
MRPGIFVKRIVAAQQNVIGRSMSKLRPCALDHASLIARSIGRSFSICANWRARTPCAARNSEAFCADRRREAAVLIHVAPILA